ncbi:hypothetical protein PS6_008962 [Mucor atramentarius]
MKTATPTLLVTCTGVKRKQGTVPELLQQQPNLLSQLATMLSPERLKKKNVKVYAVDQRPGQFIVKYPKACRSGFNHGFNLCEAVNFATGNWVHYGLQCVESNKSDRRQPCFSHDNLLVTALRNRNLREDGWLSSSLMQVWSREMEDRKCVRNEKLKERIVAKANVCERLQCLCTCDIKSKVMRVQFTDDQLFELAKSAMLVSLSSESWVQRFEHMLESKTDLDMKKLRIYIKRAPLHRVPKMFVDYLKEFVNILARSNANVDSPKPTQTQTRYERCQDLIARGKRNDFKRVLLPHIIESYAAELKEVDDQITDKLFASNDINHQKAILDQGVLVRSDSNKFQKLTKFIENIKESSSAPSVSFIKLASALESTVGNCRIYAQPKRPSTRKKTTLNQNWISRAPSSSAEPSSANSGQTIGNARIYAQPKRPSGLKKAIDYKQSSSYASSSSSVSSAGSSQSHQQYSSHEKSKTDYRRKGKDHSNYITKNETKPASQFATATKSVNSAL